MRLFSASLSNIGQLFGSITMGIAMGAIGRKKTIMVFCLPLLAGWIIVGMSEKIGGPKQVMCICVGRVFQGIGIMSSVTQTYLVEVADAERRYFREKQYDIRPENAKAIYQRRKGVTLDM